VKDRLDDYRDEAESFVKAQYKKNKLRTIAVGAFLALMLLGILNGLFGG